MVRFQCTPGEVVVDGERPAAPAAATVVDDLALEILRVVVDEHSFDADETGRRFHLVKRSRAGT